MSSESIRVLLVEDNLGEARLLLQCKLLILKRQLEALLKGLGSAVETARILSELIEAVNQDTQPEASAPSRQLDPSTLRHGLVQTFEPSPGRLAPARPFEIELDEERVGEEKAGRSPAPDQVRLAAYRIAEEALTSMFERAKPSQVTVRLDRHREGRLRLTLRDHDQGFDVEGAPLGPAIATTQDYAGGGFASGCFPRLATVR
jgi:signal transduction histidine kinase